jgi:hypothetical protein
MTTYTNFYNLSFIVPGFNEMVNVDDNYSSNILKLNKVKCRTNNNQKYTVIRYDKDFLSIDLIHLFGLCRSIILNEDRKVVSFAPPKSIPSDRFIGIYPENKDSVIAQEFVEGTMINVFWDPKIGLSGGWEIATRNTVGATSSFYKSPHAKTFREMFLEAARVNNLNLDKLDRDCCYSFVLQHHQNRIVVPFKKPQLYLVAVYNIVTNSENQVIVNFKTVYEYEQFFLVTLGSSVKFPQKYTYDTYNELIEKYASMNTSYDILGVVLYNVLTGERCKIRNPVYEQVRNLRGNQPKLQYQYLSLRKDGKVKDFLKFYPENKQDFSIFRDHVHLFTETLYSNYISCYIKKEKPLIEFSEQYRTHMFNIHQIYMNELREKKLFITNTAVINYVNNLHPSLLMFCLNYQMRKRNVDNISADHYECQTQS